MARALVAIALLMTCAATPAAQRAAVEGDVTALRSRVERRFEILPVAGGVVLTPHFKAAVRSIEIADGTIALDGTLVTGAELRQRLGADADLVLQLSYLDTASRRSLAGVAATPTPPVPPGVAEPSSAPETTSKMPRARRRGSLVRIGGSVKVETDEHVTDDVVAIGGSADVDGEVDGDVVVVGGSANLGPRAHINGDVVVIGGSLSQDPAATIDGEVHNVGFGDMFSGAGSRWRGNWRGWDPWGGFRPVAKFLGTLMRVGLLMLFAALVLFVAPAPVGRVADRVAAEPVKSWLVGFVTEILFLPVFVLTVFVLAVSIIGIPVVILLVPVVIVGGIMVFLVGFTGLAFHLGRTLQARVEQLQARPYLATLSGIVLVVSPLLLGRLVGLTGEMGVMVGLLVAVGVAIEYIAWTAGLGAAALARFGHPVRPSPEVMPPAST
ncbi:MAG: hypothetical protein ND807_01535 [Vicinamibacterales bacterium]|nr:hypothetical protein [Vicinamibacterales bacterium]